MASAGEEIPLLKLRFDQFLAPVYRSLELVNPIGGQLMQGRSRSFAAVSKKRGYILGKGIKLHYHNEAEYEIRFQATLNKCIFCGLAHFRAGSHL